MIATEMFLERVLGNVNATNMPVHAYDLKEF